MSFSAGNLYSNDGVVCKDCGMKFDNESEAKKDAACRNDGSKSALCSEEE